jgi:hypothetical protein
MTATPPAKEITIPSGNEPMAFSPEFAHAVNQFPIIRVNIQDIELRVMRDLCLPRRV